jgi:hypothetical protein
MSDEEEIEDVHIEYKANYNGKYQWLAHTPFNS